MTWKTGLGLLLAALLVAGCTTGAKEQNPVPASGANPAQQTTAPAVSKSTGTYVVAAGESSAQYQVKETFLKDALKGTAIGKTTALSGELKFENGKLKPTTITADVQKLQSDRSQRDNQLKTRALETNKYPTAEFTITSVQGDPTFTEGKDVAVQLVGKWKIHGVEKPMTLDAVGRLQAGVFTLTTGVAFKMQAFSIEPPNVLNVIAVEDDVKLDILIVAKGQ